MPGLRHRPEDIEPNLNYELERYSRKTGTQVTMNREAREMFLNFAVSRKAIWAANFRDLSGAVTRMATLAPKRRITVSDVQDEIIRLREKWHGAGQDRENPTLLKQIIGSEEAKKLDLFDRILLEKVIEVCRNTSTISEAGKILFEKSRLKKSTLNDSDRLRKYLAKFNLNWKQITSAYPEPTIENKLEF